MKELRKLVALVASCAAVGLFVGCGGSSSQISITLTTPSGILSVDESEPSATPPVLPTLNFAAAVGGDTKNQGVTWPTKSNNLLTGTSCSGWGTGTGQCGTVTSTDAFTATYTPPSNLSATETITLKVESITNPSVTKTATISVVLPPTFTLTSCNPPSPPVGSPCILPEGKNGVPYTSSGTNQVTIAFTGGVEPYSVTTSSTTSPTLAGLCLNVTSSTTGTTATISGTPCSSGTTTFTVTVTDSGGAPATSQLYSIKIDPPPPLSVTTTSLPSGFTNSQYSASLQAQGGVAPLTWTMTPPPATSLPPGLAFNTATGLISGIPRATGNYCFSVQVTDSALIPNPAPPNFIHQVAPASPLPLCIGIQAPPPLQITTASLQGGTTATGYSQSLQATGGVPGLPPATPYTWSVTQGQLPAGLTLTTQSDGTGLISGTPILAGDSTFTVQVTDSEVTPPPPVTRTYTISIAANTTSPTANDALLQGSYSFLFNGFDKDGSVIVVGTITADGKGNITSGTEDSNRNSGVATGASVTGTYSIGADGRGTMELTSVFQKQAQLTVDYHVVLDSSGGLRFFEDNSTETNTDILQTHGEGIMKPVQGSGFGAASFSGNYAFVFPGQDLSGKPAALGGVVHANGSSLSLTPGTSDFNDAGTFSSGSLSGNFSFISGNRGEAAMTFPLPSGQTTLSFVFHFVSPSDLFFVEIDSSQSTLLPTVDRLGGEMILQNPNTPFNNTVLAGTSVASGVALSGGNSDVFAGLLTATTCDGSTPISFSYDENNGGTVTSPSSAGTCTMGLNGNGRASFSFTGFTAAQTRVAAAYLTGPGQGFVLGSDAAVTTGLLEQQSGGPFADSSVLGSYALSAPLIAETQVKNVLGQVTADGNGNVSGVVDEIDPPATSAPTLDQALSAAIAGLAVSGRGTLTPSAPVPSGFPASGIFYIVSPGSFRMISIDTTDQHPNLFFFNH